MNPSLPQLSGRLFLTDGGMETTLIFHEGIALPLFAAFTLLKTVEGREVLRKYYRTYAELAQRHETGLILESPTWRANPDWATRLGYTPAELADANREAIGLMHEIRQAFESERTPVVISGNVGPRGDGYEPSALMSAEEAACYHEPQIRTLRDAGADFVSAFTLNYIAEAEGFARAAARLEIPCVVSFTVETDGKLPTGQTLREAIEAVDAASDPAPVYYMINCAHPAHFEEVVAGGGAWLGRIRGIRANSSERSHAELNESADLDEGDPHDLGQRHRRLRELLPQVNILGGCCGTDHRHVEAICRACKEPR